jgi:hypothetical protein
MNGYLPAELKYVPFLVLLRFKTQSCRTRVRWLFNFVVFATTITGRKPPVSPRPAVAYRQAIHA